jgi:GTP-binding protein HflX
MAALAAEFAEAEVVTDAGNGRVLAFLNANAEVYRQEFNDDSNEVIVRCHLPRHLLHHIAGPTVRVRFLERNTSSERNGKPDSLGRANGYTDLG